MKELLKELNEAFVMTNHIPVTGDAVDAMAVLRAKLRKVYTDIESLATEECHAE